MSRDAKIIIFSLILIFSIYNKNVNGGFFDSTNDKTTTKTSKSRPKSTSSESKFSDYELSEMVKKLKNDGYSKENISEVITEYKRLWKEEDPTSYRKRTDEYKKYYTEEYNRDKNNSANQNPERRKPASSPPKTEEFDIDSPDYTTIPQSGHSPYDAYFGKGIYNDTDNSIVVTAPAKTHVVFVVINTYTKRRIRNEFIRKGETFTMTKIPYGTYDYMYFTGRNWSKNVLINNGTVRGGFKDYQSFNKNEDNKDQMEFERGYYGSYTIRLKQTIGGNLETKPTSEADFFN